MYFYVLAPNWSIGVTSPNGIVPDLRIFRLFILLIAGSSGLTSNGVQNILHMGNAAEVHIELLWGCVMHCQTSVIQII